MKSSFPLSNEAAIIYTLLFLAIVISCLPKIRCINLDRPKCQFVKRRKQRKEEVDEEIGTVSYSRTFIDCPLFPCIEFVSETTTSYHSGTDDWYIPSDDSMVDVVINERTYSVPLSLVMPNYTAWKWERERRKMIRNVENNFKPKRSTSLPCINNVCFKTKHHLQRKCMESTALPKSPFIISSKIKMETMNENRVDVKEGDKIREFWEDSNLSSIVDPNKELFSENHSLKNKRENYKFNVNEESQHRYINRSKSLDRDNYSMQKALESCREENETHYALIHHSIDNLSFTYHQDVENSPNMRMKEDLKALESSVYFTNSGKHTTSPKKVPKVKRDVDNKPSYKTKSFTKMESYPKILKCSHGLHSLGVKVASSKPGSSLCRSAESVSAQRASLKKEDGAYSSSLNCLDEKNGKLFQQKPHSLFTCLKYETEICPTCDCEFPPKLRNSSSASSRTGNEAPFILMECEMDICPFLLEETPSGLYLNPSPTSRIAEEMREDDFIEVGNKLDPSCKKKSYSSSDDENYTNEIEK